MEVIVDEDDDDFTFFDLVGIFLDCFAMANKKSPLYYGQEVS